MSDADRARVALVAGRAVVAVRDVSGGQSGAARGLVTFDDGRSAFVKIGETDFSAAAIRWEHDVYSSVLSPHCPSLVGFDDTDGRPLILLEDLSSATWPPPWSAERVDAVRRALDAIHALPPPPGTVRLGDMAAFFVGGWSRVAAAPEPFLALGLCSRAWLDRALPMLVEAACSANLAGEVFTHFDVRSDNLCFTDGGRVVFVDWGSSCAAHPLTDLVTWAPSLALEGGPAPDALVPDPPTGVVAVLAGHWASVAGLSDPPGAPLVRPLQQRMLAVALPWAARTVGLQSPSPCRPPAQITGTEPNGR